jgi:phosphoribosylformylglycinamidine cyclo-ligase
LVLNKCFILTQVINKTNYHTYVKIIPKHNIKKYICIINSSLHEALQLGGITMDYKNSGVDIEAGYKAVELMREHIKKTHRSGVLSAIGGFSGGFSLEAFKGMEHPTLMSGTDGVGTKLKIAFILDKHDTIGIDCVAMCVNDIACAGAEPLFFLDYIACGKNEPEKIATIVSGVSVGCVMAGAALIGGETAEMPGFYPVDEYDLAGFAVGIVDKKDIINGDNLKESDVIIGIASSGIHSNGYSLVRKVFQMKREVLDTYYEGLSTTLGEALLTPTKIYVKSLKSLKTGGIKVKACSHITGGGFYENIPRMLPEGVRAVIKKDSYVIPPIFNMLKTDGSIDEEVMYNTYNMGIGMMVVVSSEDAEKALQLIKLSGEEGYIIGEIIKGDKGVSLC